MLERIENVPSRHPHLRGDIQQPIDIIGKRRLEAGIQRPELFVHILFTHQREHFFARPIAYRPGQNAQQIVPMRRRNSFAELPQQTLELGARIELVLALQCDQRADDTAS